jgi:hypothetical protein
MILQIHTRFIFISLLLLAVSCGPNAIHNLEQELLAVHDEVMPEMERMKAQRRKLISRDYASTQDSLKGYLIAQSLHESDSLMWAWMLQYVPVDRLRDSLNQDQLVDYLKTQRAMIGRVSDQMKSSMRRAEEILMD